MKGQWWDLHYTKEIQNTCISPKTSTFCLEILFFLSIVRKIIVIEAEH